MDNDLINFMKCDVFTPDNISKLMASNLHKNGTILEPSVGTGNLLKFIDIDNYEYIDVYELKNKYLDEIEDTNKINKFNEDFIKADIHVKYDNIIMNPPYIKIQDLSKEYRKYLRDTFKMTGIIDIYYAFIVKCIKLLNDTGIMIAITPNSYLYNKSSHNLRKYLFDNQLVEKVIDYKDKKVFSGTSVYCCITIITKTKKDMLIYNDKNIPYSDIIKNYSLFNFNQNGNKLKDLCKITNGIATLRDKIFIHDKRLYHEPCWRYLTSGLNNKMIIYPYNNGKIIDEDIFKANNPLTYEYLVDNKPELAKRDKGRKKYPTWYAYGRSQSIKYSNKICIYIPCFIDPLNIDKYINVKKGTLHHSCLCIEPNDENDVDKIVDYIKQNIEFITENSSKRSGGWINISSRILYQIPLD